MTAGTTSIQGANCNGDSQSDYAHQGIVIDNVERFPARVYHNTFPFWESYEFWESMSALALDRFIVHIAEGSNHDSLAEFLTWQSLGMLDERTTIIHGTGLPQ